MHKKTYSLAELSSYLGAELEGDPNCIITGLAPLEKAGQGQISFFHDTRYKKFLAETQASAVILDPNHKAEVNTNLLLMKNPHLGYAKVVDLLMPRPQPKPGIHPTAVIGENCKIAQTAMISPYVVIGDNSVVGEHTFLGTHCSIGEDVTIADHVWLYPNVTVYHNVQIGNRTIVHSGAIIGSDGFGMVNDNGKWVKMPQVGGVRIGSDVEIGASTTIDRGALEDTVICDGVKLDNQIQIGHNVYIGEHTAIAGCTAIAGSVRIGKYCMIGGGSSIGGHLAITDQVILTGTTGVSSSITTPGIYSSGLPLQTNRQWRKNAVRFLQLDDMARRLRKLEER